MFTKAGAAIRGYDKRMWLWVPAFAGTTRRNCRSERSPDHAGYLIWATRWRCGYCGYFRLARINAAMSCASFRLIGWFGMVAWGRRKNEAIISAVTVSLAAIEA